MASLKFFYVDLILSKMIFVWPSFVQMSWSQNNCGVLNFIDDNVLKSKYAVCQPILSGISLKKTV